VKICNSGKNSKEKILVLLTCSADGIDKLPPLVTENSDSPYCFKSIIRLTIKYVAKERMVYTGHPC
jgi:hypothetical protein